MMTSTSYNVWQNLPDLVFSDLMLMVGLESIHNIQKCRDVCHSWNVMISHITKQKKDVIKREAESLAEMIRVKVKDPNKPLLPEITTAASLAHHGVLGSVEWLNLWDVDLASVPAYHLASLAGCVTGHVEIENVRNCDLISILDSVKCQWLSIDSQTLSTEETRALVRAMESRVEMVQLGMMPGWMQNIVGARVQLESRAGDVQLQHHLDIMDLIQYSGQGKCREVWCCGITADRYREEVRSWAQRINWRVKVNVDDIISMARV